jgi:hypothetical protein
MAENRGETRSLLSGGPETPGLGKPCGQGPQDGTGYAAGSDGR